MTAHEYLRVALDLVAIVTTAINFWLFCKVPAMRRAIKLLRQTNNSLRQAHDGLIEQHRLITDEAVKLHQLLNGRR